jgi:hypothetical protein
MTFETMTILAGHPYFELAKPAVWQQHWNKKWTVRWRDFHAIKQDAEFDTQQQALAFASQVCRPPVTVTDDACDLADADRFWRDLAEKMP